MYYVSCPANEQRNKPLDVCLTICKESFKCGPVSDRIEDLKKDDPKGLSDTLKRLKIPPTRLKEFERAIDVAAKEPIETSLPPQEAPVEAPKPKETPATKGKLQPRQEEKLLQDKVIRLVINVNASFWDLGVLFEQLYQKKYWDGCKTWEDFKETSEFAKKLPFKGRVIDHLRSIVVKLTRLGIKREECHLIDWTKLREILPIVNQENVRSWLEVAADPKMTVRHLNDRVALALGTRTEEDLKERTKPIRADLYPGQYELVWRAFKVAWGMADKKEDDELKIGFCLQCLAEEFLSTYPEVVADWIEFVRHLAESLEARFPVRIEISDRKTGEVIR